MGLVRNFQKIFLQKENTILLAFLYKRFFYNLKLSSLKYALMPITASETNLAKNFYRGISLLESFRVT